MDYVDVVYLVDDGSPVHCLVSVDYCVILDCGCPIVFLIVCRIALTCRIIGGAVSPQLFLSRYTSPLPVPRGWLIISRLMLFFAAGPL